MAAFRMPMVHVSRDLGELGPSSRAGEGSECVHVEREPAMCVCECEHSHARV